MSVRALSKLTGCDMHTRTHTFLLTPLVSKLFMFFYEYQKVALETSRETWKRRQRDPRILPGGSLHALHIALFLFICHREIPLCDFVCHIGSWNFYANAIRSSVKIYCQPLFIPTQPSPTIRRLTNHHNCDSSSPLEMTT